MSDQCSSTCRWGQCILVAGHITPHYARGHQWPNDAEPAQTRPAAPVAADTASTAMTVPGNGTEALSVFPPPTVPRCDGCNWWCGPIRNGGRVGTCCIAEHDSGRGLPPMWPEGSQKWLYVKPDHYCAAHEPATKENA